MNARWQIKDLIDLEYFNTRDLNETITSEMGMDNETKPLTLARYLTSGFTLSGYKYSPSTAFRYKKKLQEMEYLDPNLNITTPGKMRLFVIKLFIS